MEGEAGLVREFAAQQGGEVAIDLNRIEVAVGACAEQQPLGECAAAGPDLYQLMTGGGLDGVTMRSSTTGSWRKC